MQSLQPPQYTLFVNVIRANRGSTLSYTLQVALYANKLERNIYQGTFYVDEKFAISNQGEMEEVGDAVLAELKDSLGLALPRPPLPEMSTDNKDKYLAMARTMSDNTKRKTSETMSIGKALSETCPGVSYECFNYANKPENNSCAMVPLDPKSGILKTYSFN